MRSRVLKTRDSGFIFLKGGRCFGRLQSTGHINAERQRKQCLLYETEFAVEIAKNIVRAKLKNQMVVLRRFEKSEKASVDEFDSDFQFHGRSKRLPRDEFNSMISLGYSVLMNELYGKIETKGLNPYFGFMHRDKEKHPTLASDMMEEWRAVIADATVMSMINGHEIHKEDFMTDIDEPGCFLARNGLKIYLSKLERKLQTEIKYLSYIDYAVSFRRGIALQLDLLVKAIETGDAKRADRAPASLPMFHQKTV